MAEEQQHENTPTGEVKRWLDELAKANKSERGWREQSRKIIKRYRDEDRQNVTASRRYNILWSNTETLRPQMYSNTPEPVVRRRYGGEDPLAKGISEVLEKSLEYSVDAYDFDGMMDHVTTDYLLPGRAVARIRYIPTFQKGEAPEVDVQMDPGDDVPFQSPEPRFMADMGEGPTEVDPESVQTREDGSRFTLGEPEEEVVYEEVRCEYVNWEDFRMSPCRTWGECRWVAFRHRMTRDELEEAFGSKRAREIRLTIDNQESPHDESDDQHTKKRAEVWEFWDKKDRKIVFISEGLKDEPIETRDDPLNLENFFPCPEPLYSVQTNNTMVPIPEYMLYQDQALELNRITERIDRLVEALKARGLYAGEAKAELSQLMKGDDNELIPVEDFGTIAQGGSLENKIAWMPIEQIAKTLQWLYQQREQLLQSIFQITGISDIMRGATDAREGVGTQQLKGRFGVMRLQPRQRRVQKFVRDLLELKAEVMSEMFEPTTLSLMTGIQIPPEAVELMRNDGLRGYRIDIETDSTIAADDMEDKQEISQMFQAMSGFVQQAVPAVASGMLSPEAAKELVKFALRKFHVSRQVEEAFEQPSQKQEQQPDPIEMMRAQNERAKIMVDAQDKQAQRRIDMMELQQKRREALDEDERKTIDQAIEMAKIEADSIATEFNRVMDLQMNRENQTLQ